MMKELKFQKLGFTGTLSLVVGNIIGVGIFTTTGFMTEYLDSAPLILAAWLVGAVYALCGAQVYAILATEYPLSGGDYQYLSKSIHPFAGYLFGWAAFFITYSGSIAALGIGAAFYLNGIFDFSGFETTYRLIDLGVLEVSFSDSKLIAIGCILFFSWINYRGILLSGKYQIALTGAIFILLVFFAVSGTLSPVVDYSLLFTESTRNTGISGFLTSLIAVLFAYSGWTTAVYVAEEIKEARKNIPLALRSGVILIGIIYLWINVVYLIAQPISDMKDVINIGTVTFNRLWGESSGIVISGIILIAVLSSLNSTILSGPRIYMAMGREGYFWGLTKELHKQYHSPYKAIFFQAVWSILLVLSGSFNQLLSFVIFGIVGFSLLAAIISIKVLLKNNRLNLSNLAVTVFYGLFCLAIMINTLLEQPGESLLGVLLLLIALPFYYFERIRSDIRT